MNDHDETFQQEIPGEGSEEIPQAAPVKTPDAPAEPKKGGGVPKSVWFIGGGCALLICAAVCAGLGVFLWLNFFGAGDPIASVTPGDSLLYVGFDLAKAQSEDAANVFDLLQDLAEVDDKQTVIEFFDEAMREELGMNFTQDALPWVGRYASFVITEGDLTSGDFDFMFIVEARSKSGADEFIAEFVAAAESRQDMSFEVSEKNKITFYTHKSDYDPSGDVVVARVGKFVYFSNSEDAIAASAGLKKSDSLANSQPYKDGIAALSRDRIFTVYMDGDLYGQMVEDMGASLFYGGGMPTSGLAEDITGMAIGLAVEDEGARLDFATVYAGEDRTASSYLAPTTDALVPGDTFFFMGMNSPQDLGGYLEEDSPFYNRDAREALDLLDQEYGVSVEELFDTLGGELAVAIGPASDGLPVEVGEVNVGITLLASAKDEAGFVRWFDHMLDVAFADTGAEYKAEDVAVGGYALQELSIDQGGQTVTALYYGADNGYVVLGTSLGVLEGGLDGKDTLAANPAYIETWKSFPSGSAPYMYLDVQGLINFIKQNDPSAFSYNPDVERGLSRIPAVALSMNASKGNVFSQTLIVFIK